MKKPKLIFLNHRPGFNAAPIIGLLLRTFTQHGHLIRAVKGHQLTKQISALHKKEADVFVSEKINKLGEYLIDDCSIIVTNYINSVTETAELSEQLKNTDAKKLLKHYDISFIELTPKLKLNIGMDIVNDYAVSAFPGCAVGKAYTRPGLQACLINILSILAGTDHKVAVAGKSISGKGTITELLNKILGYKLFSCGNDFSRILAEERTIRIEDLVSSYGYDEVGRLAYDRAIDGRLLKELKQVSRSVCEGRMAGYFAKEVSPKIFRVYMKVSPKNAAIRLFKIPEGERKASYKFPTQAAAAVGIEQRNMKDMEAYLRTYKFDYTKTGNYHAVIDTNKLPKHRMFPEVLKKYTSFLMSHIN